MGEHYTSETNILKALRPLFLDSLKAEFDRVRRDSTRLKAFHDKLGSIRILDLACGCGNFLVIAYRELRLLELDVLRELFKATHEGRLAVSTIVFVDVDQFYGIELEEFPAQIAQVALWMTDHQMNQLVSADFGQYFARLPLKKAPTISYDNALAADWIKVMHPSDLSYIVGNPPFIGKALQSAKQKAELLTVFKGVKSASILDYVSCWYQRAAEYMSQNKAVMTAFVSTNSITQGEQIGVLWPQLCNKGIIISFAHRTFVWSSEARGKAAVHCVIIGFGFSEVEEKKIFEYAEPKAEPLTIKASWINPYLVDAADIFLENRRSPICDVPAITFGSMANDEGHLLMNDAEKKELVKAEPGAAKWMRPFMQVDELLYGSKRWCLWLSGISPKDLSDMPLVHKRVLKVQKYRKLSTRAETRELAKFPSLFGEIRQPSSEYFIVPRHTGQDRNIIPIAKVSAKTICGDANFLIADHSLYAFGIVTSLMHMAWVRAVCGRIKSDYRYSAEIVYNNFPWPEPTERQQSNIESAAQAVFDERKLHPDSNLASLYDPVSMPPNLAKAHNALDRVVDAAYGRTFKTEAGRVAFLFGLYEKMTSLFSEQKKFRKRRAQKAS